MLRRIAILQIGAMPSTVVHGPEQSPAKVGIETIRQRLREWDDNGCLTCNGLEQPTPLCFLVQGDEDLRWVPRVRKSPESSTITRIEWLSTRR